MKSINEWYKMSPELMENVLNNLGPLKQLLGTWEGKMGDDIAPSDTRKVENNKFRERISFAPLTQVDNHEQKLFGLRYSKMAWRLNVDNPFHEEIGYFLYEPANDTVMRCFLVPRGVSVIAGGKAKKSDKSIHLKAELGSSTYGICSNLFLDNEFKTTQFEMKLTVKGNEFTYEDITTLKIKGQDKLFLHTDKNTLNKVD